ncbi:MAG: undecaprenyl/decaprenyl-phosphate alpha-N-acetylglucosaminyl 1-phosphate transferase, partial [Candidatus Omnitrophica bacterium]|nr:undecaprenyl/decaprenyl-phosphate alpha-N-acetylglucosaminyl 1-phosphate transferase [Candidatus Omnitrophota bacterium]
MKIILAVGLAMAVALIGSLVLTPWLRRVALAVRLLDRPNRRKIHKDPVPKLGGVAVFLAWLIAVGFAGAWTLMRDTAFMARIAPVIAAGACGVLLGLWDDARDLSGRWKLFGQLLIGLLLVLGGVQIDRISNPFGGEIVFPEWLSMSVTLLWVAGMMNAVNLIDGLDGLAAGVVAIASVGLVAAGFHAQNFFSIVVFAALAGACAGFLVYNFFPARIFLGDAGSQFLGVVLAAAPLVDFPYKSATAVALLIPLTSLALPIYDTWLALLRRLLGRRSVFRADKYHLHHRLLKMGLSHRQVVLFLYLVSGYLSCVAFMFVLIDERYAIVLLVLLALGLLMGMRTLRFVEFRLRMRYRRGFAK